jgi:hypothetical protein
MQPCLQPSSHPRACSLVAPHSALTQHCLLQDDTSSHEPSLWELSLDLSTTLGSLGENLQEVLHDRLSVRLRSKAGLCCDVA